ncbi:MAG: WD40/YVTN/BNR-like repeat-containing protein [Polyangia bacterium]
MTTDPSGGMPAPNPTPDPSSNPNPDPNPNPTPTTGDFVWTVESSGRSEPISAIWGSGAHDVWAAGGHGVVHSNGDGTWTTLHEDTADEYQALFGGDGWVYVGGLACADGLCQGGIVLRSSDGGATWTRLSLGSGVSGFTADGGTVYADSADLFGTTDHFATTSQVPLAWATSNGIFADGGALYAYGGLRGAEIRRSSDGGQSWTTVYSGFSGSRSGTINSLTRGDKALFALANGCSVPACVGALFRSLDGGESWQEASRPQDRVTGVWAPSDAEIFVGGTALMRSSNGGATFAKVTLPVDKSIAAIWGVSADDVYVAGQDGTIVHGRR